jgi:hypothetical protein
MGRTVKMLAVLAVTLGIGLAAGFALGQRQMLGLTTQMMERETTSLLSMHVEMASAVRVGDTDRALTLLDALIDSAVVNLHALPVPQRESRSMREAKLYHSVIPPQGPNATAVRVALETVSAPDSTPQASGLARLLKRQ